MMMLASISTLWLASNALPLASLLCQQNGMKISFLISSPEDVPSGWVQAVFALSLLAAVG